MTTMTSDLSSEKKVKKEVGSGAVRKKKLFLSFFLSSFAFRLRKLFFRRRLKPERRPDIKTISARALIDSPEKYCVVDFRSLDDFFKDHIILDRKGISFNIPYDSLKTRKKELMRFITKKMLIYSDDDSISRDIASELIADGFDVTVLIGGYASYKREMYQ